MKPGTPKAKVRCRLITDDDREAVAALLREGFPGHRAGYWEDGLGRLRQRTLPEGLPRYGYCLDTGGGIVGVILLIAAMREVDGATVPFINVASWYVVPDYRAYAQLLVSVALRNKAATYTNVTPAPHTWPIIENQGYTKYCNGLFIAAAALKPAVAGVSITDFGNLAHEATVLAMPDYGLLQRHHGMGCRVLIVKEGERLSGYVFRRYRIRSGRIPLPAMLLLHGPDRDQLVRIAGNLGRWFLREATVFLVMDANGPVAGLTGFHTEVRGRKYYRGAHAPALCSLADTEFAVFGV